MDHANVAFDNQAHYQIALKSLIKMTYCFSLKESKYDQLG